MTASIQACLTSALAGDAGRAVRLASVSKPIAALAVMVAAEEGVVDLDETTAEQERAQRDGDLEKASRLLYEVIPALKKDIEAAAAAETDAPAEPPMVKEEVGADDIAEVISSWTGIPAGRMMEGETEKLLRMEQSLQAKVVGQAEAVAAVSGAVRRARAARGSDPLPSRFAMHHLVRGSDPFLPHSSISTTRRRKGSDTVSPHAIADLSLSTRWCAMWPNWAG